VLGNWAPKLKDFLWLDGAATQCCELPSRVTVGWRCMAADNECPVERHQRAVAPSSNGDGTLTVLPHDCQPADNESPFDERTGYIAFFVLPKLH